jgi:hypothetical protein
MHIDFTRSGGFAGMRLSCSVDTDQLSTDQATELDKLVDNAAFFELPDKLVPEQPRPDRFEYRVNVEQGDKQHSVTVSDAAAPESLRPLLNYLTTLAIVRRKG